METWGIIVTLVCLALLIWVTNWFVSKRNPVKANPPEQIKSQTEKPQSDEIEDPMNP